MLEATTYTRIYGQQQFGKCGCVARSQPTLEKYSRKIFSCIFCVQKYFYNKNKANYGSLFLERCGSFTHCRFWSGG